MKDNYRMKMNKNKLMKIRMIYMTLIKIVNELILMKMKKSLQRILKKK